MMSTRPQTETTIDLQPKLSGKLMELRPLREEDFDALLAAASDPLIWELHPERDRWRPEVFRRYFQSATESKGALAVLEKNSGKIIGSSRYHDYKPHQSEIEIGYTFLERAYWGGAYNSELKSLMLQHIFQYVELVVFAAGKENLRSCRALEKIGAKLLREEQRPTRHGNLIPYCVYGIRRTATTQ
jgi:RimJ/RimL family protein N-acetyltransferase